LVVTSINFSPLSPFKARNIALKVIREKCRCKQMA